MQKKGMLAAMLIVWLALGAILFVLGVLNMIELFGQVLPGGIASLVAAFVVYGLFSKVYAYVYITRLTRETAPGETSEQRVISINVQAYGVLTIVALLFLFALFMQVAPVWLAAFAFVGMGGAMLVSTARFALACRAIMS